MLDSPDGCAIAKLVEKEAAALLEKVGIRCPPVDAYLVAQRLGLNIQIDPVLKTRGFSRRRWDLETIVLGSKNPNKSVRKEFTIAHEIGEVTLKGKVEEPYLEDACNLLAVNLLLPKGWFIRDIKACDFDLFELKKIYSTVSHEVISFRMLEFRPMIITIFDNGKLYRRRSSYHFRIRSSYPLERQCLEEATAGGEKTFLTDEKMSVKGWPIFTEDWKRVILKTEFQDKE
jgi:Zn-dependent peptidase ImmA (M78 family)